MGPWYKTGKKLILYHEAKCGHGIKRVNMKIYTKGNRPAAKYQWDKMWQIIDLYQKS